MGAPGSRVVYVDYDQVVLAHQQDKALLADDDTTAFICEDVRNVEAIFGHPDTGRLILPDEPTAAMWISFMHCIPDSGDPAGMIRSAMDRLPSGSYLAVSHLVSDDPGVRRDVTDLMLTLTGGNWGRVRERKDVEEFFDGLELVEPGLVNVTTWRPDGRNEEQTSQWIDYGGLARKPLCETAYDHGRISPHLTGGRSGLAGRESTRARPVTSPPGIRHP